MKELVHTLAYPFKDEENSEDWPGRIIFSEMKQERRTEQLFIRLDQVKENIKDEAAAVRKDLQIEQEKIKNDDIN